MAQFTTVGRSIRRAEGVEKVTGKARFTGDLDFPGLLEGRVLRSPFPHALIDSIDVRDAEALPGVHGVLTRESVKDIDPYYGHCLRDRPLIATDRVRYVGEPVVAVAAVSGDVAEEGLSLVRVRYQELPLAATMDAALAPEAPVLHDANALAGEYHELAALEEELPRNVCHHERLESGDVAAAFEEADAVFEDTFEFPMICHYSLEPHTAVARFEGDEISLWTSSAHPFLIRAEIAQMFRVPMPNVRVTVPYVGGAFGGKSYFKIEPLAVALARTAGGRPVRRGPERVRVHAHHPAPLRPLPRQDRGPAGRHGGGSGSGAASGHGCLRRQRPAGGQARGHPDTRAVPHSPLPHRRLRRVHQHGAGGLHALHRRTPGDLSAGVPHGRCRPGPRPRPAGVPPQEPVAPQRAPEARRQAHGRGPAHGPAKVGLHGRLGRNRGSTGGQPGHRRGGHRLRGHAGVHGDPAAPERRQRGAHGRQHRGGAGGPDRPEPGGGRGASHAAGTNRHARHGYRCDAVRPFHRRQPLHHGDGHGGQVRRRGSP